MVKDMLRTALIAEMRESNRGESKYLFSSLAFGVSRPSNETGLAEQPAGVYADSFGI